MLNGNIIIAFFVVQYLKFAISMVNRKNVTVLRRSNTRLENLRKKPELSLREQKEFITLRYKTNKQKHKFSWKAFFIDALIFLPPFLGIIFLLDWLEFEPNFWITLLIATIVSVLINQILFKFGIQKQDSIETIFR